MILIKSKENICRFIENGVKFYDKSYIISIEYIDNGIDDIVIKMIQKSHICFRDLEGGFHNPVGPAIICYQKNRQNLAYNKYYFNNKLHRLDGPAIQHFFEDGSVAIQEYYVNDKRYHKHNFRKAVKKYKNGYNKL